VEAVAVNDATVQDENERLREANEYLRARVGELESVRVEWQTAARQQAARADVAEDAANTERLRADTLAASIAEAQSAALNEAAEAIRAATFERLTGYGTEHAETARVAIEGCVSLLRRRAKSRPASMTGRTQQEG
jgi:hypothetical protein